MEKAGEIVRVLKKEYPKARHYLDFSSPMELLVAAILSAQVRDETVNATTPALFRKYRKAGDYAKADLRELESIVSKVTFFRNKAKSIKEACRIIEEKHKGKVPETMEELVELPGIGRKTANAILINAFDKVVGIVVDTHVIRLSQRLGLTKNKDPEKIEQDLMKIVPRSEWKKLPWLLKNHGRGICKASVPECSRCVLERLCPKTGVSKSI